MVLGINFTICCFQFFLCRIKIKNSILPLLKIRTTYVREKKCYVVHGFAADYCVDYFIDFKRYFV